MSKIDCSNIRKPLLILTALTGIAGSIVLVALGVKTLLVDPINKAESLNGDLVELKRRYHGNSSAYKAMSNDVQTLLLKIRKSGLSADTKLIAEGLENIDKQLEANKAAIELEPRDSLAFIGAERENIKLVTGINASFLQALGSTLILVTAFVAIRNLRLAQKSLEVSENKLTSEIIAKATDHLGSEDSIVRLGGVNTLIWIAGALNKKGEHESAAVISNTLMGFIVSRSLREEAAVLSDLPIDMSAALDFLQRFKIFNITELSNVIKLSNCNFQMRRIPSLSLTNSDLRGSLLQNADMKHSCIKASCLDQARLESSDLSFSKIEDSSFTLCNLCDTILNGASIRRCVFSSADFGISFNFRQINELADSSLLLAKLPKAIFDGTTLRGVKFNGADLTGSSFKGCKLENVSFDNAILKGADFEGVVSRHCSYSGSDFSEVRLKAADLKDEDLRGIKNLFAEQLVEAETEGAQVDDSLKAEADNQQTSNS
jgi:fluoroquinolone resistance protein